MKNYELIIKRELIVETIRIFTDWVDKVHCKRIQFGGKWKQFYCPPRAKMKRNNASRRPTDQFAVNWKGFYVFTRKNNVSLSRVFGFGAKSMVNRFRKTNEINYEHIWTAATTLLWMAIQTVIVDKIIDRLNTVLLLLFLSSVRLFINKGTGETIDNTTVLVTVCSSNRDL